MSDRIRFAAGVSDLAALGARSIDDLLRPAGLATWARATELLDLRGVGHVGPDRIVRFPLPGTPDESGRVHERPRGAGTGHALLCVYHTTLFRGLRARFTHPRSASLAEREWNLACHLRAAGVSTPELLAVAARGVGLYAGESALVTRELAGMIPFDRWVHTELPGDDWGPITASAESRKTLGAERQLGLEAVARLLDRLARSGAVLPSLRPSGILVQLRDAPTCAADTPPIGGALHRLPGVAVTDLNRAFLVASPDHPRAKETYLYLRSEIEGLLRDDERALLG